MTQASGGLPPLSSEVLFRLMVESVKDYAVFATDPDGVISTWNTGAERIFGYPDAEILGRPIALLFTPEDRARQVPENERRTATQQGRAEDERWHLRRDGSRFWASGIMTPLQDERGALRGFVKVCRDNTAQRRQEEHLRQVEELSRRQYQELTEIYHHAPVGLCVLDTGLRFVRINERLADINGLPVAAHIGRTVREVVPALADIAEGLLRRILTTGEALFDVEIVGETPAQPGVERTWVESWLPLKDEAGRVAGISVVAEEVTERKQLEAERGRLVRALEEERARLRYVFEHAPAYVVLTRGPEHVYELVNPAQQRLFGDREFIGKTVREAFPEATEQGLVELLDRVYQTGEPYVGRETRILLRLAPGAPPEERYADFVYQPIRAGDGSVTGIFVHAVDVTELVRARRAAEGANRLKDEFLATLSHELRNPLNNILGYASLLRRSPEVKQLPLIYQAAETIHRNARAQAQLINDLLDLSRLQTGKLALERRALSLAPLVGDAVESVRAQAESKEIKLKEDFPAEPLLVNADPVRVQQVVWNLVTNAVKFTPKGGRVSVCLSRQGQTARLEVEDTGQGITPEFLPHIFEMFRQADASTTRTHGGMGIGLALVKQLTELHGGRVEAFSAGAGRGARFLVTLPLIEAPHTAAPDPPLRVGDSLAGSRILVVDDMQDSLELLHTLLTQEGAGVMTAGDGAEGLRLARRESYDLILCDISMPEMDGYEFLRRLRAEQPRYKTVPAIALTGFGREEDIEQSRRAGFTAHLTKPVEIEELLRRARAALHK